MLVAAGLALLLGVDVDGGRGGAGCLDGRVTQSLLGVVVVRGGSDRIVLSPAPAVRGSAVRADLDLGPAEDWEAGRSGRGRRERGEQD